MGLLGRAIPTYPKLRGYKSATTEWANHVGSSSGLIIIVVMALFYVQNQDHYVELNDKLNLRTTTVGALFSEQEAAMVLSKEPRFNKHSTEGAKQFNCATFTWLGSYFPVAQLFSTHVYK